MALKSLQPRIQTLSTSRVVTLSPNSWRAEKTSSTARGYGYAWQKARLAYLRAHPLCVKCQELHRVTEGTVVDHKEPHRGDMKLFWDSANWQTLCATHHSADKQREEAAGR